MPATDYPIIIKQRNIKGDWCPYVGCTDMDMAFRELGRMPAGST